MLWYHVSVTHKTFSLTLDSNQQYTLVLSFPVCHKHSKSQDPRRFPSRSRSRPTRSAAATAPSCGWTWRRCQYPSPTCPHRCYASHLLPKVTSLPNPLPKTGLRSVSPPGRCFPNSAGSAGSSASTPHPRHTRPPRSSSASSPRPAPTSSAPAAGSLPRAPSAPCRTSSTCPPRRGSDTGTRRTASSPRRATPTHRPTSVPPLRATATARRFSPAAPASPGRAARPRDYDDS